MSRKGGGARGPGRQSHGRPGAPGRGRPPETRAPRPGEPRGRPAPRAARPPRPVPDTPAPGPRRMVIYGIHPVEEALRGKRKVHRIWAADPEPWRPQKVTVATAEELEERAGSDAHQGVAALVDPYPYADAEALLRATDPMLVALDEVTDPQNLGAIARTAEAVGATGIVIPERRSAEVTAAVCKASAGAVEHLPIARVRNLADFLADAKHAGAWCYGAAAGARTSYRQPDYSGAVVLVLGAEGKGLRPRVAAACDDLVSLPLRG